MKIFLFTISVLIGIFGMVIRWKRHDNWFISRREKYFNTKFALFMDKVYTSIAFGLLVFVIGYAIILITVALMQGKSALDLFLF